jgi:transcription initiation factor TFIIH subunit 2
MSDSDGEYVADDLSDDDIGTHHVSNHGTRSTGPVRGTAGSGTRGGDTNAGSNRRRAAWEDLQRSWDNVVEGADGSINSTVEGLREAGKRKRSVAPLPDLDIGSLSLTFLLKVITRYNSSTTRHHPASYSHT